jgi:hypothetical protein
MYLFILFPCHHGMAFPQYADGRTAPSMEGSCEWRVVVNTLNKQSRTAEMQNLPSILSLNDIS